jgi:hypothetical protein
MEPGAYCRDVESYLCRKNDGHLTRIVGPAFELVSGWASAAIPLSVVMRAVDLAHARYYANGPKRRPLRIEYCEADVGDLFDEWKRAIGVGTAGARSAPAGADDGQRVSRRRPLAAHVDQVASRLRAWRGATRPAALDRRVADVVAELDATRDAARTARGDARQRIIGRLAELERLLHTVAHGSADEALRGRLRESAALDLEPFRNRMAPDVFRRALDASLDRLLTEHVELPRLSYD